MCCHSLACLLFHHGLVGRPVRQDLHLHALFEHQSLDVVPLAFVEQGRQDLHPQPSDLESAALLIELHPFNSPGGICTPDPGFNKPPL